MEKLDLSLNSRQIQEAYDKVVRGDPTTTYVVYKVDNALALSVDATGNGSLDEFVEHFVDGHIQFGLARVTVPGSDVSKVLLLGWCPDNSPLKLRLSFATNFAEVSKVLSGYHVQITARDPDDLDVDEFLNRVGAAAGARYSLNTQSNIKANARPAPAAKPVVAKTKPTPPNASFIPKSTGNPISAPSKPKPFASKSAKLAPSGAENDGWGDAQEIEERDFSQRPLEDVPSAYKPTKVNIDELRKQKSDTTSSQPKARTVEEPKDTESDSKPLSERLKLYELSTPASIGGSDGRLTSLPKPKVGHSVASRFHPQSESSSTAPVFGAKPSLNTPFSKDKVVGGVSRNFGSQGGKSPAQLWAEKRGQYKSVSPESEPVKSGEPDLSEKFSRTSINQKDEDEDDKEASKPVSLPAPLPARNLPPPPPRQPEPKSEEEEEEEEEEEAPAPPLATPLRNLPPPPVRNIPAAAPVAAEPEPVREPEPANAPEAKGSSASAVAEYDYDKEEDNELEFKEGDLIVEIDFVDDDWWSGKHSATGEVGLFPATYVALVDEDNKNKGAVSASELAAPAAAEENSKKGSASATAAYDYDKDEDNEISFAEGDLIVEIEFVDDDWWSGKHSKSGDVGLFPANYVVLVE